MSPHHVRADRELRVTVSFPGGTSVEEQADRLNALGAVMKQGMGLGERLVRLPGLQQKEGPLRVFVFEFVDPKRVVPVLRAVGGWYMRNPEVTITFRADGPGGGINLQLKEFSTVAFAQAAAKIGELMVKEAS